MGSFPTTFEVLTAKTDLTTVKTDVLIVPVFQKKAKEAAKSTSKSTKSKADEAFSFADAVNWTPVHQQVDKALGGDIRETLEAEKFKGDCAKRRVFRPRKSDKIKARWVIVVGLGLPDKLDMKKFAQAVSAGLKETFAFDGVSEAALVIPSESAKLSALQMSQAAVFGAIQSTYKTQEAGESKIHKLKRIQLIGASPDAEVTAARTIGLAEAFTKDLANIPANIKKAETLAEAARGLATLPGITVDVLSDVKKIKKEMPAFWAVAQGAANVDPPRFIKVTYTPAAGKKLKKIALVGKGVIFDTGGVQVKPGNSMNDMKFDMTGAATVLAVVKAASELKLKGIQVTAYVAATQNLTGEEAYLPDSIIDSASGKKIEIRHTDAEGRVTLADAVYKATLDKPAEIVTIATLTGSAGVAVGACTALMGTDDDLLNRIEKSGKSVGELIQKLELLEMDYDDIKSDRDAADLSNTGKSRSRGHLSAGAFVISFANDIPTAHLDIAGGDAKDGNATGIAVKGLIQYLRNEAS